MLLNPEFFFESHIQQLNKTSIARNHSVLKCITEAILLCGRQCISFRGYRDDNTADVDCNKGNSLALPNYSIKSVNTVLAKHFYEAGHYAKYTNKSIQNHLIDFTCS